MIFNTINLNALVLLNVMTCFSLLHGQDYWKPVVSSTRNDLYSVSFGDEQTGYICGKDSLLLKTINGGKTWSRLTIKGLDFRTGGQDLIHVEFVSPMVGYMIQSNHNNPTYQGALFKTTDGGLIWTPESNVNIAAFKTFYFDEDNGFQVGSAFFQGKTVAKQLNGIWQDVHSFSSSANEFIRAIDFYDTHTGLVGGDSGFVYRTMDGGSTWDTVRASKKSPILCLKYITDSIIIGGAGNAGSYPRSVYSSDAGTTWFEGGSPFQFVHFEIRGIALSQKDEVIRIGSVYQSSAGFIEWFANSSQGRMQYTVSPMNAVAMKNDSIAFIVGDSGTILCNGKYETSGIQMSGKLSRYNVMPNPASQYISITGEADFGFELLAPDGKLIANFGQDCQDNFHLDVSVYPKGVFFIRIRDKNRNEEVLKIIIQ